jgi:uncharacterized protein (DUF433 family)
MKAIDELLSRDPKVMGGEAIFSGTRVPLQALIDYLAGGDSLEEFLVDFPGVSREAATEVIKALGAKLDLDLHAAAS